MYQFSEREIEKQVAEFMDRLGITPKESLTIQADGKIHRFAVRGDKHGEKTGAYCIYSDGWPAGWVADWRQGIQENWSFNRDRLDDEGKKYVASEQFKRDTEQDRIRREKFNAEARKEREAATLRARKQWDEIRRYATCDFPYLQLKQVDVVGEVKITWTVIPMAQRKRYDDPSTYDEIVLPLYNIDGKIQTLQYISEDGRKRFFAGASTVGAFFKVGFDYAFLKSHPKAPILICEGYATMATIFRATNMPCVAAMNAGNLSNVAKALKEKYPDRKIIIMADNDRKPGCSNVGLHKAREARDNLGLQAVIYPPFEDNETGSDWNDYEALYGQEATSKLLLKQIRYECLDQRMKDIVKKVKVINAADLMNKKFDPVNWAIEGIMPAGLTILAGGPKVGKSLFATHIGLGIAVGGCVLGKINVEQGDVLYLALEDTEKRLQDRLRGSGLDSSCMPSRLDIVTEIPRQDEGGLDYIKVWLAEHPEAKLVIVDTLQKFRKLSRGKLNVYAEDYETLSEMKKVADEFNVSFLVIHHLKKMSAKEEAMGDWINQLSGSAGITGCADTILALKRERVSTHGILRITGRDVEEKDYAMKLDGFGWYLEGDAEEFNMPSWKKLILDYLKEHEKLTPMQLSDEAGITIEAAKKQLQRAFNEGLIKRIEHGVYVLNK